MAEHEHTHSKDDEAAPGEKRASYGAEIRNYLIGLGLAGGLTAMSFWVAGSSVFWGPGVAIGLCVLAVAQMGIHLVFFLHLTTGADNANNALAVAFGVLVIVLVGAGSLWIMSHLNANMMPMDQAMNMQIQR